jgi:hypothetical protein
MGPFIRRSDGEGPDPLPVEGESTHAEVLWVTAPFSGVARMSPYEIDMGKTPQ